MILRILILGFIWDLEIHNSDTFYEIYARRLNLSFIGTTNDSKSSNENKALMLLNYLCDSYEHFTTTQLYEKYEFKFDDVFYALMNNKYQKLDKKVSSGLKFRCFRSVECLKIRLPRIPSYGARSRPCSSRVHPKPIDWTRLGPRPNPGHPSWSPGQLGSDFTAKVDFTRLGLVSG